jgi:aspartate aminotransferase-like enzyme
MRPPGLLIVAVGPRAWAATERATFPRFFWDLADAREMALQEMTSTTPPLSMIYAYHAALEMIAAEGLENTWERHRRLGEMTREGIARAGLELFARDGYRSNSLTAFLPPQCATASDVLALLRNDYGIEAQGGQGHLKDRLIRVGHMGWVHEPEMVQVVEALADVNARFSSGEAPERAQLAPAGAQ